MIRRLLFPAILFAISSLGLLSLGACASSRSEGAVETTEPTRSVRVSGDVEHQLVLDPASLRDMFAAEIRPVIHRTKQGEVGLLGLPLLAMVEKAGPRFDPERKHHDQAFAVMLRARDGYAVTFSYEELRPDRDGEQRVFLAFAEQDGPLPDRFAPARLVIEGGGGNSRRIAGVTEVVVIDLVRAAAAIEETR